MPSQFACPVILNTRITNREGREINYYSFPFLNT